MRAGGEAGLQGDVADRLAQSPDEGRRRLAITLLQNLLDRPADLEIDGENGVRISARQDAERRQRRLIEKSGRAIYKDQEELAASLAKTARSRGTRAAMLAVIRRFPVSRAAVDLRFELARFYRKQQLHVLGSEALEEFLDLTAELDALAYVRARRLAVLKDRRADAKEVLALQMKLGSAHDQAGRIDEALRIFADAYATYKADDGALLERHVEDFCSLCNSYGWASYEKGMFDQAEQLCNEALHGYRVKLGQPKHERALATLGGVALLRQDAGRIDEAIDTYGEALALKRDVLGPDNISTLTTMTFMAGALRLANRKDEASAMASEAYKMRKALLGSDHPDTIMGACELAALSEKGEKPEEALGMYEKALKLQLAKLGPDHPATLKTTAALEKLRTKLGRHGQVVLQ